MFNFCMKNTRLSVNNGIIFCLFLTQRYRTDLEDIDYSAKLYVNYFYKA